MIATGRLPGERAETGRVLRLGLMRVLIVGLGGICGALARYGIALLLNDRDLIPWGTLVVNLLGCFLLSFFLTVMLRRMKGVSFPVLAVATGFLGSFTTLSAISVEGVLLFRETARFALLYLGFTMLGGFTCTWAGYFLGGLVLGTGWGKRWKGQLAAEGEKDD